MLIPFFVFFSIQHNYEVDAELVEVFYGIVRYRLLREKINLAPDGVNEFVEGNGILL